MFSSARRFVASTMAPFTLMLAGVSVCFVGIDSANAQFNLGPYQEKIADGIRSGAEKGSGVGTFVGGPGGGVVGGVVGGLAGAGQADQQHHKNKVHNFRTKETPALLQSIQNVYLASRGKASYLSENSGKLHNRVSTGEKWRLIPAGDEVYSIQNVHTGLYLSDAYPRMNKRSSTGEKWRLVPSGGNTVGIQNVHSKEYLSDSPNKLSNRLSTGEKWRVQGI